MCESPCVIEVEGRWYLFYTYGKGTHYSVSDTPFYFAGPRFLVSSHASEVFNDSGRWYVTHCGAGYGGLGLAGIEIARDCVEIRRIEP
jgi:hypothetical protein